MLKKIILASTLILSPLTYAAGLVISVEVPKLDIAEYHTPYTAIWVESAVESDKKFTKTLAVWYDIKKKNEGGQKWFKDLRQWWRKEGRELTLPIDGVSGATKLSGTHELNFTVGQAPLTELPKGNYQVVVEMAREGGGREFVKVPFTWPVEKSQTLSAKGSTEVGAISLTLNP